MNLTGSDDSGEFILSDYSSGSLDEEYQSNYSFTELDNVIRRQHTGRGEFFKANDQPSRKEYVYSEKQQLPEQVVSSDMINILTDDDNTFTIDTRPVKYLFTVEKSMYDGISRRMLEFFGSIEEFNNLIGEPVNRYRQEYKELAKLREIFFRRVGNEPDLDKFVDYYRWLDTAVSDAITQIFPISAGIPDAARNIVESHILERNKYAYKYQNLKSRLPTIEGAISGTVRYNWRLGHAPLGDNFENQRRNTLWWQYRAERDRDALMRAEPPAEGEISAGVIDSKVLIHTASLSSFNRQQRMAYQFSPMQVESPVGSRINRRRLFASNSDVYDQFNLDFKSDDDSELFTKRKFKFIATIDGETFEGRQVAPFAAQSSSVTTGYRQQLDTAGLTNIDITNLHEDSTGPDYEIPMQGPFTERHVGGLQFRHNQPATTDKTLRREGFLFNASAGTLNLIDVHTPTATPFEWTGADSNIPQGKYYREELAKRPVNIRNIKSETNEDIAGSVRVLGNYVKNYEVVQTSGREVNNLDLRKNPDKYKVSGSMSSHVLGLVNYPIPQRSTVKTVFTERFSAPGELATSTPAALDIETQQYSPNNALPFRNRTVRQPLQSLLSVHCGKYGFTGEIGDELLVSGSFTIEDMNSGSIGIPIASFHKIQRNTTHRILPAENSDGPNSWITGSQKDNPYVTRPIPSADRISWFNRFIAGPATTQLGYGNETDPVDGDALTDESKASPGEQGAHEIYSLYITSGSQLPEHTHI